MPFRNLKKRNGAYSMSISVNLSSEEVTIVLPKIKKKRLLWFLWWRRTSKSEDTLEQRWR